MQNDCLHFVVPGIPRGKGRPRFSMRGGFGRAYTDSKTRSYEAEVKEFALKAGAKIRTEPCRMVITAVFPIPKSYSKKKKAAALSNSLRYTKKPDTDNLSKIKDALNQIAFEDDSQVYREEVTKQYGEKPELIVEIYYERLE